MRLLAEVRRRGLLKVATGYLIVTWLVLEVGATLFNVFELPHAGLQFVFVLLVLGFPIALLAAWQGWFGSKAKTDPAAAPGAAEGHAAVGHHEGPWFAAVFGVVALFAFAVAIGVRFFGMSHSVSEGERRSVVTPVKSAPIPASATTGQSQPAAAPVNEKSVAVLPFIDMSEKKDQEYFSDGLSEELIDMLAKVPELRVPARTSSFYFKGKQATIADIAKALGVAHVLEGSVRKSGNIIRITAQLIRVDNGYHVWSETYDRQLTDIFKVQDDIAGSVVKALKISIMKADLPRVAPTANSEAYSLYLQALSLARSYTSADSLLAHDDLQRALRLDPKFAPAWAALAELYADDNVDWSQLFPVGVHPELGKDWKIVMNRAGAAARDAAERAVKLDPNSAEAHLAMARVLRNVDWNWEGADAELTKARELDSGSAAIIELTAASALTMGRVAEGLELATFAAARDPLGTAYSWVGGARHWLGALDEAAAAYHHLIELYPTGDTYHFYYALVLLSQHSAQAALDEMERENAPQWRQVGLPLALDALGRRSEADREQAAAERRWGDGMAYQLSYVYAARNDVAHSIYWLERAYRQHDGGLKSIKFDPMLTNIERDPRYKALLRTMKLPVS